MLKLLSTTGSLCLVIACLPVLAADKLEIRGLGELQAFYTDAGANWLDGGFSGTRFDEHVFPLQLGRVGLNLDYHLSDTLWLQTAGHLYADNGIEPELTEAYFTYRPVPAGPLRLRARVGAFHLPISLENRDVAWTSRFSTTPSAINTWIGEELRTVGAEISLEWPGRFRQSSNSWKVTAAVLGSNDAAGTILDHRGWASHDRQTGLFSRLQLPTLSGVKRYIHPFYENDDDPGYYAIGEWGYLDALTLQLSHYDNKAKIGHGREGQSGWRTKFNQLAAEWRLPGQWTLAAQAMDGSTLAINPRTLFTYHSGYTSVYFLANKIVNRHSFSARVERFSVDDRDAEPVDFSEQDGDSMMLSWEYEFSDHWRFGAEWLRHHSDKLERMIFTGNGHERINQLMLTVQYRFHN